MKCLTNGLRLGNASIYHSARGINCDYNFMLYVRYVRFSVFSRGDAEGRGGTEGKKKSG